MVGVAIGVGAAATVASGAISASGASGAAGKEASAAMQAAAEQQQAASTAGFEDMEGAAGASALDVTGLQQAEQNAGNGYAQAAGTLSPYITAGTGALSNIAGMGAFTPTGLATAANTGMSEAQLQQTPGYQFTLQQGLESQQNSAAARGLGVSGAASKAAANYSTGLADNTYTTQMGLANQAFSNELNSYNNQYQDYSNTAAMGAQATNNLAGIGTQYGLATTQGILGTTSQMAANTMNAYTDAGNALVAGTGAAAQGQNAAAQYSGAGTQAQANDYAGAVNSLGSAGINYAYATQGGNTSAYGPGSNTSYETGQDDDFGSNFSNGYSTGPMWD
jgi:hypothetical protein